LTDTRSAFNYLGAHVPIELHRDHNVSKGKAFFDLEPQFPCSALFLDPQYALLIKLGKSQKEFRRIGIGYFWDTETLWENNLSVDPNATENIDLLLGFGNDKGDYGYAMVKIV